MPEGDSFFRLPVQIVAGLIGFVLVVLVAIGLIARLGSKSNGANLDRATEQSLCSSVIDNIERLPGGIDASSRASMTAAIAKHRDISFEISTKRPEYRPITDALSGVVENFGAGRPNITFPTLIRECAVIGVPPH